MLKGCTPPRTPRGISSLAIEFTSDADKAARFLPDELEPSGDGRCAVYFAEWQFATDDGEEYLDRSEASTRWQSS